MKNYLLGAMTAIALIFCLGATGGGMRILWSFESKRPSFQKAVGDYVRDNCQVVPLNYVDVERSLNEKRDISLPPLHCFYDPEKAEQDR